VLILLLLLFKLLLLVLLFEKDFMELFFAWLFVLVPIFLQVGFKCEVELVLLRVEELTEGFFLIDDVDVGFVVEVSGAGLEVDADEVNFSGT
jgi:hypothetical protein